MQTVSPRVLLIGPLPPPSGGMANQTRQLARLLRSEGVSVELVQVNAPYRPAWVTGFRGVRALFRLVPYLWYVFCAAGRNDVMHLMANSGWSWHLFAAPALLIARLRGLPAAVNYRGGKAEAFLNAQRWFVVPVLRIARALVVPSPFLRDVFGGFGIRACVIPNIVDLSLFADHSGSRSSPGKTPHLVVTRNLEAIYAIDTALAAFARVRDTWPEARLTVAGSGPERERLEGEVRSLGLADAVTFSGRLEPDAMARLYASAHVMLNPSTADNTPNSILEAWASGVAVVSTRVGGVPYLVNEGVDAVLVPPGDAGSMAAAVESVLASETRRLGLCRAGSQAVERFTWAQAGKQWMALYAALVDGKPATASLE